jgi:hypothetical protein
MGSERETSEVSKTAEALLWVVKGFDPDQLLVALILAGIIAGAAVFRAVSGL